jgi:hypothetical protein
MTDDTNPWALFFVCATIYLGGKVGYDGAGVGGCILGGLIGGAIGIGICAGLARLFGWLIEFDWFQKLLIVGLTVGIPALIVGVIWLLWGVPAASPSN